MNNPSVTINIGGHEEIVRWWSPKYWKDRKFRERQFEDSRARRLGLLKVIAEGGQDRINGPKVGSVEWIEKTRRELDNLYRTQNLDQNEEVMPGANAKKVAVIMAYEGSWQETVHHWAHRHSTKHWRTRNVYQAFMFWFFIRLRNRTQCPVRHYGLCTTEKILLGRLKGDGYHGCGIYDKPRYPYDGASRDHRISVV